MKTISKTALSLALTLLMVLSAFTASALPLWDFSGGTTPDGWTRETTLDEFEASEVLEPVNPNATQEAKNLLAYLQIVSDSAQFVGGQFDMMTNEGTKYKLFDEFGVYPGLYSARYRVDVTTPFFKGDTAEFADNNKAMSFTDIDKVNAVYKKNYDEGAIILVHSDSAPRDLCAKQATKNKPDLYPNGDPTNAIWELDQTNPDRDMQTYALWMKYQAGVIEGLTKLEELGVNAYIWRPWVEYQNHAFCGRTQEGYDAFARVYQQTVQMLIDAGLKGFLVAYSPSYFCNILTHHPGMQYIDTYSFTMYSEASGALGKLGGILPTSYEAIVRSGKPMGFSELSCRTSDWIRVDAQARASSFDTMTSILSYWPKVAWVSYWDSGSYTTTNAEGKSNGNDDGVLYWYSENVLNLSDIPDYRTGVIQNPGIAQLFNTPNASGGYVGLAQATYSASQLKAMGIGMDEVRALRLSDGFVATFYTGENGTGDFYCYGYSTKNIPADVAKNFKSLTVSKLDNVSLNLPEIYASIGDEDAYKANDGLLSLWEVNTMDPANAAEKGTAWLKIDLGKNFQIGRYVVKNASYANRNIVYNTADFSLQYSVDGETWITVDSVEGNTLGQVTRDIQPVIARYFRLLITKPNSSTDPNQMYLAAISEFELFGVDPGLLAPVTPVAPENTDTDTDVEPDMGIDEGVVEDEKQPDDEASTDEPEQEEETDKKPTKKPVKNTYTETYFPWWIWVIVAGGVVVVAGGVVLLIVLKKRKTQA